MRFTPSRPVVRAVSAVSAAAVVSTVALVAGPVGAARAADPTQTWAWPASGTLAVNGHGYGHGHGLSQWGAYGAAVRGLNHQQILAHYYPGTTLATQPEAPLRVLVLEDTDNTTEVVPAAGQSVATDSNTSGITLSTRTDITRWRAVRTSSGVVLQYYSASAWHNATVSGRTVHQWVQFDAGTSGAVRVVLGSHLREYRGSVRATPVGSAPGLRTVVYSTVSDYLNSVVPSEMPSSWRADALRAQAVAARTYALYDKAHKSSSAYYDTCDTTACQVFSGVAEYTLSGSRTRSFEASSSTSAVQDTAGQVLTYGGSLAFTQFSASNGGWTTDGGMPYLKAFADPYDGAVPNSANTWSATIKDTTLERAYPGIGNLLSLTVTRDGNGDWGGRVTQVVLQGSTGSTTISGSTFRSVTGIKSVWWAPDNAGWQAYDAVVGPGDWDGDGHDDVIARDSSGRLWLHPGTGSAGYGPRRQIGTGFDVFTALVAPGDWDGDGHPDLLGRRSDGTLWLYAGTGTGSFKSWSRIGTGFGVFDALVGPGDWDGDGHPDLLARRSNGSLWLYSGNGAGRFAGWRQIGTGFGAFTALVGPGDWDGNHTADLLARRSDGTLWLYRGRGDGGFAGWTRLGGGWSAFGLLAAAHDGNGDGPVDLVAVTGGGTSYLYEGDGSGWFLLPRVVVGTP